MKRFLKKRWLSIPVIVVLLLLLAAGSVFAAFNVFMGNANVDVGEAFTISNTTGDDGEQFTGPSNDAVWEVSLYPGESKSLNVLVSNASSAALAVSTTGTGNEEVTAAWAGPTNVPANNSIVLTLTVTVEDDAYPGTRIIYFEISRG